MTDYSGGSGIFGGNPFSSFFFPGDNKNVPQDLRQKIALAMLMQKQKAYPKTLGEGLGAIGESLGDIGMMRRIEAEAAAAENYAKGVSGRLSEPPSATGGAARSYAPTVEEEPLAQEIAPRPTVPPPQPPLVPPAPAVPLPPDQQQSYDPNAPVRLSSPEQLQDFRAQNPMQRGVPPMPAAAPMPPAVAAPPAAPPVAPMPMPQPLPEQLPAQNFNDRYSPAGTGRRSSLPPGVMPGAPMMAFSGEPSADLPAPANGRDLVARTLAPPPAPVPGPPNTALPLADPGIRKAPQPQQVAPQTQQMAQAGPQEPMAEPGYVSKLPPLRAAPPIMTDAMRMIQKEINDAPPAYRDSVKRQLAPAYEAEANKLTRAHEDYKDYRNHRQALELKIEDQKAARRAAQDAALAAEQTRKKTAQELIDYGQTRTPGALGGRPDDPRLGTDASPQRTGIPTPDPMPSGVIPNEWAKDQAKKISATQDAFDTTRPELAEALDLMTKIRSHSGKARSIGLLGGLGQLTPEGQGFSALDTQLKGKNLVAAYQKIKGTGPVGEREGENIAKAQSALNTAATEKDYNTALDTLETTMRGAVERIERKLNRPVTAYQKTPDDPVAPDIGQIDDTWKDGKVRQYIGGNPRDKERSWKIIR